MRPSLSSQLKPFAGFFLRFVLLLALFFTPWRVVRETYARCYQAAGNLVFGWFGPNGTTHFEPSTVKQHDTDVVLMNRKSEASARTPCDSGVGYNPTAFLTALILSTPIPWSRKWRALLAGLIIISCYVALRVGLFLFGCFSMSGALQLFELGGLRKPFGFLAWLFVFSFAGSFVIPLPIWFLLCVRRGECERVLLGLEQAATRPRETAQ